MDKKAAIEKILKATQSNNILGSVAGASWNGQSNGYQPQLLEALQRLKDTGDVGPLKSYVATLHMMQTITDKEHDELIDALES